MQWHPSARSHHDPYKIGGMNQRTIGIEAQQFPGDLRAAVGAARRAGFGGVTLPVVSAVLDTRDLSSSGRREVRHLLGRNELQLIGLRHDLPRGGLRPGVDLDAVLAGFRRALEAAAGLGAGRLLVDLGPLPPGKADAPAATVPAGAGGLMGLLLVPTAAEVAKYAGGGSAAAEPEPAFEASADEALRAMGELADRVGVPVALGAGLADGRALARALDAADCPAFGAEFDPSADDAAAFLADHGGRLLHVRGRDARRGTGGRREVVPPGEGDVDWAELRALLDDAGYAGPITAAAPAADAARALAVLRDEPGG